MFKSQARVDGIAPNLLIDGEPIASWFESDPKIRGVAEIDMNTAELPLVAVGVARVTVDLAVP